MHINTAGVSIFGEPVPEGDYVVWLSNFRVGPSRSTGKPSFTLEQEIVGPAGSEFVGRKVRDNGSLQQEHIGNIKRALMAFGIGPEIVENPQGYELEPVLAHIMENRTEVPVRVTIEEGQNGQKQNRVRYKMFDQAPAATEDGFATA